MSIAATVQNPLLGSVGAVVLPSREAHRWLETFNHGHLPDLKELFRETGGLQAVEWKNSSEGALICVAKENLSDQFCQIEFPADFQMGQGVKITFIPPPEGFTVERMTASELIQATRARLNELQQKGQFSGTLLIAKEGRPIFTFAGGIGEINLETKFNLGSMNKMFTAVAIMQLVQKGEISLDDPIGKYLPNYPNQQVRNVTIRQLLNHTGGTGDIFDPEHFQITSRFKTLQEYIDFFGARSLGFVPGTEWRYSNYGYILLGRIIEAATGADYYEYIQNNVYRAAEMAHSGSYLKTEAVENLAPGFAYDEETEKLEKNTSSLPARGSSAGGGYSNAPDILSFANALTNHQLLDQKHTELLTAHLTDTGENDRYGYGFAANPEGEARWFGHTGGHVGLNSSLDIYPDSGYTVIVMANFGRPTAQREAQWIRARLPLR